MTIQASQIVCADCGAKNYAYSENEIRLRNLQPHLNPASNEPCPGQYQ